MTTKIKIRPPLAGTYYEVPARDDLVDIKIGRPTRARLHTLKQEHGFKNLDHMMKAALDAWEAVLRGKK